MGSDASAQSVLPIVVGVQAVGEYSAPDVALLGSVLEAQLQVRRQRYPNSQFVLLLEAPAAVGGALSAIGARMDMRVIDGERANQQQDESESALASGSSYFDGNELGREPHQERSWMACCHVLYFVASSAVATASTRALHGPDDLDAGGPFETKSGTEIVRLALVGGAGAQGSGRCEIRRIAETDEGTSERRGSAAALQRTDDFNRRAALLGQPADLSALQDDLVPPPLAGEYRQGEGFRRAYSAADRLAIRYQQHVRLAFRLILALAVAGTVSYGLFSTMTGGDAHLQLVFLVPYLCLLVAAYGVFYLAKKSSIHDCFVEYRALAEALRVQYYWAAGGLSSCAADAYSHEQQASLAWIRLALRSLCMLTVIDEGAPNSSSRNSGAVLSHWIIGQKDYFARTYERARRISRDAKIIVRSIFVLGACATVGVILQSRVPLLKAHQNGISLVSFLCPSFATAMATFVNKIGWTYQAQHSVRMLNIYTRAEQLLVDSAMPVKQLAFALGREALRENEAWAVFRSERSIDGPSSPFKKPM